MAEKINSFIKGMDQDTSKSKQDGYHYYKGANIKLLTEEGSSSANIENEDGNLLSFSIPDTLGFWKIRFNNPEDPTSGDLKINYLLNNTLYTTFIATAVSSVEDLMSSINSGLSSILGINLNVIRNGEYIYIIPLDSTIVSISGTNGLSNVSNTYEVGHQTALKIIGWTTLRNEIILFTTNETSATPSSAGQIWKFEFDPITKIINNIGANSTLTLANHLIYNNNLNFSTHWHIGTEAVGHYENSKTGRVYWTDEYNNLRTINALDPDLAAISPGDLSTTSSVDMSIPVLYNISNSGSLARGSMMQYSYRLFNVGGAYTTFSPVCNPIPLGDFNPFNTSGSEPYDETGGVSAISGYDKAIKYTISNIDTSFEYIEHIAIQNLNGAVSIYKFKDEKVPGDGNLEVIHSDRGDDIPITPEEFAFLTRTFKRCKTITIKDKRLIAANVDTIDTSLDGWDSRAYRFAGVADTVLTPFTSLLKDTELTSIPLVGPNPAYTSVPTEHDAINDYNVTESIGYKFQTDGVTLGGNGLNISYSFTYQDLPIKSKLAGTQLNNNVGTANTGYYAIEKVLRNQDTPIYGTRSLNGEVRSPGTDYTNFRGPGITNTFTGYARGEVYRFGIVFYDKASNPYNVKWIGDIKFPEAYDLDGDGTSYAVSQLSTGTSIYNPNTPLFGRSIGIEFNINISDIQELISGYEIVRVKRGINDKTRLGTGIFTNFTTGGTSNGNRYTASILGNEINSFGQRVIFNTEPSLIQDEYELEINGSDQTGVYVIPDSPSIGGFAISDDALKTGVFISPLSIMSNSSGYSFRSQDRLKTLGFYSELNEYGSENIYLNKLSNSDNREVTGVKTLGFGWDKADSLAQENKVINSSSILSPGEILQSSLLTGTMLGKYFTNTSSGSKYFLNGHRDKSPAGIGDVKQGVRLASKWNYYGNGVTSPVGATKWRECSYDRSISNQYGGNTFEARSKNEYISTGAYERILPYSLPNRTYKVFGGDTYVHQFSYLYYYMNVGTPPTGLDGADHAYHLGLNFPVESGMNLAYMYHSGRYGNKVYRDWYSVGSPDGGATVGPLAFTGPATYDIASHYLYENETKKIFYPADFIKNTNEEFPHRIWASEHKIDGELLDSWTSFLTNNYTEVEGQYGEINKITVLKDKFYFFQDRAFGVASINDRSVVNDENGVALTVGSGGILDDYGYISRNTGTKHKLSVITTGATIHFFDAILKKWMRYDGSAMPLSDVKGLHSFFLKYNSSLLSSDRILKGSGIHGVFDRVRNKVYMTFLGAIKEPINNGELSLDTVLDYTISYNENIQAFESFSDCIPAIYLETDGKILVTPRSTETGAIIDPRNKGYLSYEGEKNNYFGIVYPTILEIYINPASDLTCVFDNLEYKSEIFINDIDQSTLTFDSIKVLNDHQNSGVIPITVGSNAIRKFRSWNMRIPRDNAKDNPRMRDYFIKLILTHTPNNNERLILHDIKTNFRPSPH